MQPTEADASITSNAGSKYYCEWVGGGIQPLSIPQPPTHTQTFLQSIQQGQINGNPVADGWAGAVMQKPLGIQKCFGRTDGRMDGWTDGPTDRPTWQGIELLVCDRKKSNVTSAISHFSF